MDFYEKMAKMVIKLSNTERELYNFATKNLHLLANMSIRDFAEKNYVSATTVLRFVRKLDYASWPEFKEAAVAVEKESRKLDIPNVITREDYRDSYLKNIVEAVKIISDEKREMFNVIMDKYPHIYILGTGLSIEVGRYAYHLLKSLGYDVEMPGPDYEFESVIKRIKREDVLLILSYRGNAEEVILKVNRIFSVATPTIISITRADNNIIQNMSDLNFYVFADEIKYGDIDITSHCGMFAILEVLLYNKLFANGKGIKG